MENLSIQSKTVQVDIPSNSCDNNSFTHISDLSQKEINFPNTGKDFGLTKESKTVEEEIPQEEIWKTHEEYPGYVFSSFGRVYSYKSHPSQFIEGRETPKGYIELGLKDENNKRVFRLLSRIIYKIFGDDPDSSHKEVDHIRNKEKTNNNVNNLRSVDRKENIANRSKNQTYAGEEPSSLFVGISWHKRNKIWISNIYINKKRFHLGCYIHPENGTYVYHEVAKKFKPPRHWKNNLPNNFQLPNQTENRDVKIQEGINKINNYLNQQ